MRNTLASPSGHLGPTRSDPDARALAKTIADVFTDDSYSEAAYLLTGTSSVQLPDTMRKLIESALVSLDGVIEAPERWANFNDADAALSMEQLAHFDSFVMGRVTYEKFSENWGHVAGDPYIDRINAMPKYVASRSLTETSWNATLLGPDPSRRSLD